MKTSAEQIFFNILRVLPAAFTLGCSWHLSSQPTVEHIPDFWNADKLVHCVCFGGLAFLVAFAAPYFQKKNRFWFAAIFVSLYGIVDEVHQKFTPGRSCSFFDWIADTVGAVLGSLAFIAILHIAERHRTAKK